MTDEMLASLHSWLDSSGRALELRVARAFRQHGADSVDQSFEYEDPRREEMREGDVLAAYAWTDLSDLPCSITAVVECKSSRDKPWVAFYDGTAALPRTLMDAATYAHAPYAPVLDAITAMFLGESPFDERRIATHIATAHDGENRKDQANDAVRQALSAAGGMHAQYRKTVNERQRALVLVAAVVTAAPLVQCELDPTGQVEVSETDRLVVRGSWHAGGQRRVIVMHESEIPWLAESLGDLARRAGERAEFDKAR